MILCQWYGVFGVKSMLIVKLKCIAKKVYIVEKSSEFF